jgi:hypothetical protein
LSRSLCKSPPTTSHAVYATMRETFSIPGPMSVSEWISKCSMHHFHYILSIVSSAVNTGWVIWICIWYSLVACLAFPSQKPCTKYISAYSVLANHSISFRSYHFFAAGSNASCRRIQKEFSPFRDVMNFPSHEYTEKKNILYIGKAKPPKRWQIGRIFVYNFSFKFYH